MRRAPEISSGLRQPQAISREPGTTVHAQIEDWLAGQIAVGALVPGGPGRGDRAADRRGRAGVRGPADPAGRHLNLAQDFRAELNTRL